MELIPVDHDPFAEAPRTLTLTPVDHDPVAPAAPSAGQDWSTAASTAIAANSPGEDAAAVGRGIINGIPIVGPYALAGVKRGVAAVRSLQNGTTFPEELKKVETFGERVANENPKSTIGGEIGGGSSAPCRLWPRPRPRSGRGRLRCRRGP